MEVGPPGAADALWAAVIRLTLAAAHPYTPAPAHPAPSESLKEAAHRMSSRLIHRPLTVAPLGAADGGRSVPSSR